MGLDEPETEALLSRARSGNGSAFAELLARHRERLRQMVSFRMDTRLAARIDASDVVQEAMTDAVRKLPEYLERRGCPFYPWLRQIAWERLIDLHRHHVEAQRRSVAREARWNGNLSEDSAALLAERLAASGTSPSGRMMREERRQRVRAALARLAPEDREVVTLRHLERLSYKETAAVLGISAEAARSRYRRAVERLAEHLANSSEGPQ